MVLTHAIRPIFVLRFYYNHPRALISTPSYRFMPTKYTCTVITSRNTISSTLEPNNFFLAGQFCTIFWGKSQICINIIWRKFAPFLRSIKKSLKFSKKAKPRLLQQLNDFNHKNSFYSFLLFTRCFASLHHNLPMYNGTRHVANKSTAHCFQFLDGGPRCWT